MAATEAPPRAAAPPRALPPKRLPPTPLERQGPPSSAPPSGRDVSLDLLRGLAMAILVVNHVALDSWLHYATEPFLSAAEALVVVSGVVAGMVFGRRWIAWGARRTTKALLHRAFVLYRASVVVVALVGALSLVPGLATEALTIAPRTAGPDLYAFDGGALRTALAVVTLEAGPWQFNILGFFVAALAVTPGLLWLLARGWWPAILAASWVLYLVGRATLADVLPSQSERPFPFLVWQLLFVHGVVLGRHREGIGRAVARLRRPLTAVLAIAAVAAWSRLHEIGLDPSGIDWRPFDAEHFAKRTLDWGRLVTMLSFTAAAYLAFRRFEPLAERTVGKLLLPLGRNSFYVFITHVFLCLAVASLPLLEDGGFGRAGNTLAQAGCLALLWLMVTRRFLFRWIPR
ncbi:MAG: OpgC domain-containing protein [Actinomycetota bacterium]|nr:OpgC domain-containing protein [Actinomycetota bacterium]